MAKSKVYFSKDIKKIIDSIDYSKIGNKVGIKIHFGEKGCNTHIRPSVVRQVYEKIKGMGKDCALIECNVLYKGSRTSKQEHIKTAHEHGFDMPIDILDGDNGQDFVEINGCKIGKGIKKYDSLIVLSHFKGHIAAGYGGSLKNLGMGLGSRAGKLDMHSKIHPSVGENCIACGLCIENCNAKAISLQNGKAKIDPAICIGCAMCIAVCKSAAINVPWGGRSADELQKKISEYSKAILTLFPNAIFINLLQDITKECDCMGIHQEPMMPDVGILCSNDIVAVDKASLDLVNKHSNGKFNKVNFGNKEKQVEIAETLGLGSRSYEIIELT